MSRKAIAAALTVALGVVVLVGACAAPRSATKPPRSGQRVAVLVSRGLVSEVQIVDPALGRVVSRTPLRSAAIDIAYDADTDRLVTAQCGGLGDDADDVVGVVDPGTGRVVYVELGAPNPGSVACAGGRAYVLHGLESAAGQYVSVVDIKRGAVESSGHVPMTTGLWRAVAGSLWTGDVGGRGILRRLATRDLAGPPVSAVPDPCDVGAWGERVVVTAGEVGRPDAGSGRVVVLDREGMPAGEPIEARGLSYGPAALAVAGDHVGISDWGGGSPETPGVAVVGLRSGESGFVRTGGAPCALGAWGSSLLAVDPDSGTLLVIDPVARSVTSRVPLDGGGGIDIARVAPAGSSLSGR